VLAHLPEGLVTPIHETATKTLTYDGAPRAGAQVEMFARAPDGEVRVTTHRTDGDGLAVLPVARGHDYLLDSVTLLPLNPQADGDPAWLTLWAALTFSVVTG
jgi:hypothetical protein